MSAWTQPYLGVQHLETDRYLAQSPIGKHSLT